MDLSSGHDVPNPYGLLAADVDYDMDSYDALLRFLGNLTVGTPEERALQLDGASPQLLRQWEGSRKIRRVLAKCREAGERDREHQARRRQSVPPERWPSLGRLDQRHDPYRVDQQQHAPDPRQNFDVWLRSFGRTAGEASRPEPEPAKGNFVPLEDATPAQHWLAGLHRWRKT